MSTTHEWSDEDFVPREEELTATPLEQLREQIRQMLTEGMPRNEVEDALIGLGMESEFAVRLVDSVVHGGAYQTLEVVDVNYSSLGFNPARHPDPIERQKLRKLQRRWRKEREARREADAPAPELKFENVSSPLTLKKRYSADQWRCLQRIFVAILIIVLALTLSLELL